MPRTLTEGTITPSKHCTLDEAPVPCAPPAPEGLMRTAAAAFLCLLLCCRSGPDGRPPETAPTATPSSPANPPATQVTGAQPNVPTAAGQPTTAPTPAAPER